MIIIALTAHSLTRRDSQVGGAIGQVALKNSKFYRSGGLYSARKLARKLFSDMNPSRSCLNVGGTVIVIMRSKLLTLVFPLDFYPYFRTTAEAVSKSTDCDALSEENKSIAHLRCLIKMTMGIYQKLKCEKQFRGSTEKEKL